MRRRLGPLALAVVLAVALLVGSGAFDTPAPAAATRIASLERVVRSPNSPDLSVAQSNDPSSIAIRHEIVGAVEAGEGDQAILNGLTAKFGTSILLVPPAGGLDSILWLVPLALGVGAVAGGVVAIARRRRTA
jgi:cytochrome c-type biogenesis protein CcmH